MRLRDEAVYRRYQEAAKKRAEAFGMETYLENIKGLIEKDI